MATEPVELGLEIASLLFAGYDTTRNQLGIGLFLFTQFPAQWALLADRPELAPKAVDQILHMAYKVFPDSAAARGEKDPNEKASMEQIAMANLMKGVHW